MRIVGLPKDTGRKPESSLLCTDRLFCTPHLEFDWKSPGVARVYTRRSELDKPAGHVLVTAVPNRGQYPYLLPKYVGAWLRRIYLVDISGIARICMHIPLMSNVGLRPECMGLILDLCSKPELIPFIDRVTSSVSAPDQPAPTADSDCNAAGRGAYNIHTIDLCDLFTDAVYHLVNSVRESIAGPIVRMFSPLSPEEARIYRDTIRIQQHARDVPLRLDELESIGIRFNVDTPRMISNCYI